MTIAPAFPHLRLTIDEDAFVLRLWQALQSSGHLIGKDHVRACVHIVDASFAPPPPQQHSN